MDIKNDQDLKKWIADNETWFCHNNKKFSYLDITNYPLTSVNIHEQVIFFEQKTSWLKHPRMDRNYVMFENKGNWLNVFIKKHCEETDYHLHNAQYTTIDFFQYGPFEPTDEEVIRAYKYFKELFSS